jgi:hypothetical protein
VKNPTENSHAVNAARCASAVPDRASPRSRAPAAISPHAAAKVLFHWLENADGSHTIRKYSFKGHKLARISEKTYSKAAKAYKGCK